MKEWEDRNENREFQEDFETPAHNVEGASTRRRPDAVSLNYLVAHTLGGVSFADPSLGTVYRAWQCEAINNPGGGGFVRIRPSTTPIPEIGTWGEWQTLFTFEGVPILEIDITSQQNADFAICAERPTGPDGASEIWLYYFDPILGATTFVSFGLGRTPRLLLDDPETSTESDVLFFYIDSEGVKFRVQNEIYATAHVVPSEGWLNLETQEEETLGEDIFLEDVALTRDRRVMVILSQRDRESGTYKLLIRESAPYPHRSFDEIRATHSLLSMLSQQVNIGYELPEEEFVATHSLLSFFMEALVLFLFPPEEEFLATHSLISFVKEELVLLYDFSEEFTATHSILSFGAEFFQIFYEHMEEEEIEPIHTPLALFQETI